MLSNTQRDLVSQGFILFLQNCTSFLFAKGNSSLFNNTFFSSTRSRRLSKRRKTGGTILRGVIYQIMKEITPLRLLEHEYFALKIGIKFLNTKVVHGTPHKTKKRVL